MITFFIFSCLFSAGFLAGSSFKHARFNRIPWEAYRWDEAIFGYRKVMIGSLVKKGDRILLGYEVDSKAFPKEGIKYD
jgi:hypothetical protein